MPLDRLITVVLTVPGEDVRSERMWATFEDVGGVQGVGPADIDGVPTVGPTVRTKLYQVRWAAWILAAGISHLSVTDENGDLFDVTIAQEADEGRKRSIILTVSDEGL